MIIGMGTKLKIGANSITKLKSISGMELSADTIESTTLDSEGWRTFVQGLKDAGEVSGSGFFNPADTDGQKAIYDAYVAGTLLPFYILFPSTMGAEWSFSAIVTQVSTSAEMEDGIPFEFTLKVSGAPSLGLTPSGGLTALVLTATGGTLSPTFANGTFYYSFGGITGPSITVNATATNHTLELYINGVFDRLLTSGSASAAITLTVGSRKFTILSRESGKTTKTYEIMVIKTS
jgi:predicted secreted protein